MQSSISQIIPVSSAGLTSAGIEPSVNCDNMNTLAIQVVGTINSSKYYTIVGYLDDQNPGITIAKVTDLSTGGALANGRILVAGIYLVNVAALRKVVLVPVSAFSSTLLSVIFNVSQAVMNPTP
jgi:hypothetical protein